MTADVLTGCLPMLAQRRVLYHMMMHTTLWQVRQGLVMMRAMRSTAPAADCQMCVVYPMYVPNMMFPMRYYRRE